MASLADVNAALATLATNISNLDTAIQAEIAAFKTAQSNNDPVAMQAALDNISAASTDLVADTASLTDTLTPAAGAKAVKK